MLWMIFLWLLLSAVLVKVALRLRPYGGPLLLSYFFGLSLIHVPGLLAFLSSYSSAGWAEITALGFQITLIGMSSFIVGATLSLIATAHIKVPVQGTTSRSDMIGGWPILVVGLIAYFVLAPISVRIPSTTAPIATLGTLIVVGIWIELFREGNATASWRTLAVLGTAFLLPFTTVVSSGFIGYGTYWALSAFAFFFVMAKNRILFYVSAPLIIYLCLSFFVAYMGVREEIRSAIGPQNASITERMRLTSEIFTNFRLLDLNLPAHTRPLDERLNQNWLVGAGVERHQHGLTELAYGGTVPWWAPIPRAVWPEKPIVGGGGQLVAQYTGIRFPSDTSVGVGQVLEFYINFGIPGVIIGFAVLGFFLAWLDKKIMMALASGNLRSLLLCSMTGLTLLQPGGNLLEIVVGTITALIVAWLTVKSIQFLVMRRSEPVRQNVRWTDGSNARF